MRLIDAESPQNRIYVSDLAIEEMKKIPTVDIDRPTRSQFKRMAVQLGYEKVVHCRECKHHVTGYCFRDINGRTNMFRMFDNDFCSYGELKEGAD